MSRKTKGDNSALLAAPAPAPVVPWEEKSKGERLSEVSDIGLEHCRQVLASEVDMNDLSPGNLKKLAIMTTAALSVLSMQVKVDVEKMRTAREVAGGSLEEFYRNRDAASDESAS